MAMDTWGSTSTSSRFFTTIPPPITTEIYTSTRFLPSFQTVTATLTVTPTANPDATSPVPKTEKNNGLNFSPGIIAGIAVGGALLLLFFFIGCWCCVQRRRIGRDNEASPAGRTISKPEDTRCQPQSQYLKSELEGPTSSVNSPRPQNSTLLPASLGKDYYDNRDSHSPDFTSNANGHPAPGLFSHGCCRCQHHPPVSYSELGAGASHPNEVYEHGGRRFKEEELPGSSVVYHQTGGSWGHSGAMSPPVRSRTEPAGVFSEMAVNTAALKEREVAHGKVRGRPRGLEGGHAELSGEAFVIHK